MSRRRRSPKTRDIVNAHALMRARERLGLDFTEGDLGAIKSLIRNNKAECLERESSTRTLWRAEYLGQVLYLVHQKGLGITTFLTREMVEQRGIWDLPPDPTPNCEQSHPRVEAWESA